MKFSSEEKTLISEYARFDSTFNQNGFLLAVLTPVFAFAGYGWITSDVIAMALAFMGLAGFVFWYLAKARQSTRILASICQKLEAEKSAETASSST